MVPFLFQGSPREQAEAGLSRASVSLPLCQEPSLNKSLVKKSSLLTNGRESNTAGNRIELEPSHFSLSFLMFLPGWFTVDYKGFPFTVVIASFILK